MGDLFSLEQPPPGIHDRKDAEALLATLQALEGET
jgi:hypothetical protein